MTGFIKDRFNKLPFKNNKKKKERGIYTPKDPGDTLIDEELKDRGRLVRIVCLIAVAVLLIGIIGTISVVNITYEGDLSSAFARKDQGENKEALTKLAEVSEYLDYIGSSVDDSTTTLNTLYKDQEKLKVSNEKNSEYNLKITSSMDTIRENLSTLDKEINTVKSEVNRLMEDIKNSSSESDLKLDAEFSKIGERINDIRSGLDLSANDISALINRLEGNEKSNYESLIGNLSSMKDNLVSKNESTLSSLTKLLGDMSTDLSASIDNISSEMTENYNNISNTFNTTINGQDGLKAYLASRFEAIDQSLTSVFQSVADGKKILAAALATKGQTVADDDTFANIRDAILNIEQTLVIGVDHLPGTIEYEYHYHVDANGERLDTDSVEECGGCYTVGFHVHTSSCPTSTRQVWNGHDAGTTRDSCSKCGHPIDHTGGTGSCPYAAWTYESYYVCGGSPINRYSKGCNLANGQIIGAHIKYADYDTLPGPSISTESSFGTGNPSGMGNALGTASFSGHSNAMLGSIAIITAPLILPDDMYPEGTAGTVDNTGISSQDTGEDTSGDENDIITPPDNDPSGEGEGVPGDGECELADDSAQGEGAGTSAAENNGNNETGTQDPPAEDTP